MFLSLNSLRDNNLLEERWKESPLSISVSAFEQEEKEHPARTYIRQKVKEIKQSPANLKVFQNKYIPKPKIEIYL